MLLVSADSIDDGVTLPVIVTSPVATIFPVLASTNAAVSPILYWRSPSLERDCVIAGGSIGFPDPSWKLMASDPTSKSVIVSIPSPAVRMNVSLPAPPTRRSAPAPPAITSSPPFPRRTLGAWLPVIMSEPPPPVASSITVPAAIVNPPCRSLA